jgi:hypothetical protein
LRHGRKSYGVPLAKHALGAFMNKYTWRERSSSCSFNHV